MCEPNLTTVSSCGLCLDRHPGTTQGTRKGFWITSGGFKPSWPRGKSFAKATARTTRSHASVNRVQHDTGKVENPLAARMHRENRASHPKGIKRVLANHQREGETNSGVFDRAGSRILSPRRGETWKSGYAKGASEISFLTAVQSTC